MNPLKLITKPIGCLCTLLGALILGFFLLGVLGLWSFNRFAPEAMQQMVENRGGFPVTVDEAGWQLFDSAFLSEDIVVDNPPNFPEPDFLRIRTLSLKGDSRAWLAGEKQDLDELVLEIEHINWVTTKGGSSNVTLFADAVTKKQTDNLDKSTIGDYAENQEVKVLEWVIRIGTVEISDYSRGEVRREKHILNYERRFIKAEPSSVVVKVVAAEFHDQGLEPMIQTVLEAILSVPDLDALTDDLNPAPDWLKEKLKSKNTTEE